jgi:hypothetical protein
MQGGREPTQSEAVGERPTLATTCRLISTVLDMVDRAGRPAVTTTNPSVREGHVSRASARMWRCWLGGSDEHSHLQAKRRIIISNRWRKCRRRRCARWVPFTPNNQPVSVQFYLIEALQ